VKAVDERITATAPRYGGTAPELREKYGWGQSGMAVGMPP